MGGELVLVAVYVDDLLIGCKDESQVIEVKKLLAEKFPITDIGKLHHCLSIEIEREGGTGTISICQSQYIKELLKEYGMENCKPIATPLEAYHQVNCTVDDCEMINQHDYQSIIGALMYLAITTRPDILHSVAKLAQRNSDPHAEHMQAAKRILRYLRGTTDMKIVYQAGEGAPKERKTHTKKIISTYPSLSDIERVVESKRSTHYEKNITQVAKNEPKVISIGWNATKINDMLNYDSIAKCKEFRSTAKHGQPQQRSRCDNGGFEESIEFQNSAKIDLDTVDGVVCHNLASNIKNKNTPVKTKLFSLQKFKASSHKQKLLWSEQLRNLSPWSDKHGVNKSLSMNRKSNLRSNSKDFLKSSKRKILRLVSPKKENKERINFHIRKTPQRNVGIQTSSNDILKNHQDGYEPSSPPPGSYHSPVQTSNLQSPASTQSQNSSSDGIDSAPPHFDFSSTVHSQPKKASRASQRKLNFPVNYNVAYNEDESDLTTLSAKEKKTYRSFNTELEQAVSISKLSYILSNIRAKLEASDERAIRTFGETDGRVPRTPDVDWLDCHRSLRQETQVEIHGNARPQLQQELHHNDPIYSEIEDESIHITESPDFANHTGIHCNVDHNPEILYAKVNKSNNRMMDTVKFPIKYQQESTALATIIQDSLKNRKLTSNITPLPTLPEPPESETASYSSPTSLTGQMVHCQSLNNVRVMEQNSPPKGQRNLSKSDLSLHRSEIFLENLHQSEVIINSSSEQGHLEKMQNNKTNKSYISMTQPSPNDILSTSSGSDQEFINNDAISYEIPNDIGTIAVSTVTDEFTTAGNDFGFNTIAPPSSYNQSTPKKQSFTTKDNFDRLPYNGNLSISCPNTPHKLNEHQTSHSQSWNAVSDYGAMGRYNFLKNVLRKSFQRSKQFIKSESKRLSTSLRVSASNVEANQTLAERHLTLSSNVDLEGLLSLNETASVSEQLSQAVRVCRQFPDLEISTEMIEAERLLLFSYLRRETQRRPTINEKGQPQPKMRFFIDDMFLPIRADNNQDIFFNYFYIVTFECGGIIKSTQSAECQNGLAIFRDCGIEFMLCSQLGASNDCNEKQHPQHAIRCKVFMLRLRKVSTLLLEPKKTKIPQKENISSPSLTSTVSSSSSSNDIVSRFRLHASFSLGSFNFVPFEYVPQESNNTDSVCVRASCTCNIPLIPHTKFTNLSHQLHLKGRAEVRFPKCSFAGFLNVEVPNSHHNWNRRWCTLDGIYLHVWQNVNNLNESPLMSLDLRDSKQNGRHPLTTAPRELCARPRSFSLECIIRKAEEDISTATVFFAADSQNDLDDWLKNLNSALDFIVTWLA